MSNFLTTSESTELEQGQPLSENLTRRFAGIARIYGDQGLQRLAQAHVVVIGVGGVGSWVVESLARSAVGSITMIDLDIVSESNVNRQLHALSDTIGKDKTEVMKERIEQINPSCQTHIIDDFISRDNVADHIDSRFDWVIDCIDDFRTKAALISHCKKSKIRVISIGGAGGQSDPSKIRKTDLYKTQHDVLLATTRKHLRQKFNFPRNPKRTFGVPCVYSDEQLLYPNGEGGLSPQRPKDLSEEAKSIGKNNALNCAGGIGSITHVTASFGFTASAHVLNAIARDETPVGKTQ